MDTHGFHENGHKPFRKSANLKFAAKMSAINFNLLSLLEHIGNYYMAR